jgi:ankyrin repeat protein
MIKRFSDCRLFFSAVFSIKVYPVLFSCILISLPLVGCRFIDVVKDGTPAEISLAVKKGADLNGKSSSGETPLICAIRYNKNPLDAALILIDAGADVNGSDDSGSTPLLCAVRISDPDKAFKLAEKLLEHKAEVNARGEFDRISPLMAAASVTGGYRVTELLLKNGADVNLQDVKRETALHYAASINGNTANIELLLKHGADVNAGSPSFTPLHRASYMGASENIRTLLRYNAAINIRGNLSESKTPLETAVDSKNFDAARILVENGADLNTQSYYNYQPFRYRNNTQTYTQKLVQVDLNTIRFERMTPLHRAVTHNNISFVEYLLKKGAGLNIDAHFGGYPLDFALFLNYYDIAEMLLKYKAPSLFADLYLADAIENRDSTKTDLLLRIGADIKRKDYLDNTPLHIASKNGDAEIIKLLLKYQADRTAKNREGKTPADVAINEETRSLLIVK